MSSTEVNFEHEYMMLGRLKMDLEYYFGNGCRSPRNLYYDSIEEHLEETEKLLNSFPAALKPEWFTEQDLQKYQELVKQN